MTREWKPGDVALVRCDTSEWHPALRVKGRPGKEDVWVCSASGGEPSLHVTEAHPVVVIDAEDIKQVERLVHLYVEEGTRRGYPMPSHQDADRIEAMADALREFADPKPPKPEEPTGLGAVVEAEDGRHFIRTSKTDFPWVLASNPASNAFHWSKYGALDGSEPALILSEGVQA
jgi:hypothetical protein